MNSVGSTKMAAVRFQFLRHGSGFLRLSASVGHAVRSARAVTGRRNRSTSSKPEYHVLASACLERKPIVTKPLHAVETLYQELLTRMELENSLLSDHEVRLREEKKRKEQLAAGITAVNVEAEEASTMQTAQDFEDAATEELQRFRSASESSSSSVDDAKFLRSRDEDRRRVDRLPDEHLLLLVKTHRDGRWHLPTALHTPGETLRQTAERSLFASFSSEDGDLKEEDGVYRKWAVFLGNAPVACHTFHYSKKNSSSSAAEGNKVVGGKVFFFRAHCPPPSKATSAFWSSKKKMMEAVKGGGVGGGDLDEATDFAWVGRAEEELRRLLVQEAGFRAYFRSVQNFLLWDPSSFPYDPSPGFKQILQTNTS